MQNDKDDLVYSMQTLLKLSNAPSPFKAPPFVVNLKEQYNLSYPIPTLLCYKSLPYKSSITLPEELHFLDATKEIRPPLIRQSNARRNNRGNYGRRSGYRGRSQRGYGNKSPFYTPEQSESHSKDENWDKDGEFKPSGKKLEKQNDLNKFSVLMEENTSPKINVEREDVEDQ